MNGANAIAMPPSTASTLARTMLRARIGAVATRSGASSPGDREPGEPARELPRRHHQHRHQHDQRAGALAIAAPQQQRGRQQIEDLHQRLRHQPRIAPQQRPFLLPQRARSAARRRKPERCVWRTPVAATPAAAIACSPNRPEKTRIAAPSSASQAEHDGKRGQIAERGARRPPHETVDVGHQRDQRVGFEKHHARERAAATGSRRPAGR